MKIKHFAGYGTVEAKRIPNKSCTIHVRYALNKCDIAAAIVHEQQISEAIEVFGKLCKEE